MPRKGYVQTEEHKKKAIEGVRKFYASAASQKTREEIGQRVREYYRTHPKHNSHATRKRISIALKKYYETCVSPLKGRKISRELVEKQRNGRLKYYETNEVWNKNKRHSKATLLKISQAMKEYWNSKKKKAGEKSE